MASEEGVPPVPPQQQGAQDQLQQQQQQQGEAPVPSRWEIELEFVQSLANLQYLNYLAQNNFLKDDKFLSYLAYLEYWRQPEYAKYLIYPNCLHILTLLQNKEFRDQVLRQDIVGVLMNDMNERWREDLTKDSKSSVVANGDLQSTESGDKPSGQDADGTKPSNLVKPEETTDGTAADPGAPSTAVEANAGTEITAVKRE